jgi:hypothetical protein
MREARKPPEFPYQPRRSRSSLSVSSWNSVESAGLKTGKFQGSGGVFFKQRRQPFFLLPIGATRAQRRIGGLDPGVEPGRERRLARATDMPESGWFSNWQTGPAFAPALASSRQRRQQLVTRRTFQRLYDSPLLNESKQACTSVWGVAEWRPFRRGRRIWEGLASRASVEAVTEQTINGQV